MRGNDAMQIDARLHSPAADRNQGPIALQLQRLLPTAGFLLEIASGTGQHAAHAAAAMPAWHWQPSDADVTALASIGAWCHGLANVLPPLLLDVTAADWPAQQPVDAIFSANLVHIAPWPVCVALMQGAARHLAAQGLLVLYGPFIVDGKSTAASNLAFDADLRQRNPAWGLRQLSDVVQTARSSGLQLQGQIFMPANNLMLSFGRGPVS